MTDDSYKIIYLESTPNISKLMDILLDIRRKYGDLPVVCYYEGHREELTEIEVYHGEVALFDK